MIICKSCVDPSYCQSILKKCELEEEEKDIQLLEDQRQSEAFYETYLENKQYEAEENKQNYLDEQEKED